jgi:hypothetical protein
MKLVTLLGRSAAVAALLLAVTAQAPADEVDDLARQIAGRSAALSQLMERLSAPETALTLVNSAVTGDARSFNRIFEDIDFQVEDRCFWVSKLVEKLTSTLSQAEECWLRDDLTTEESFLYIKIAVQHGHLGRAPTTILQTNSSGRTLIPAGAFRDELRATGLATCKLVFKHNSATSLVFAKPERFCLQQP